MWVGLMGDWGQLSRGGPDAQWASEGVNPVRMDGAEMSRVGVVACVV